MERITAKGTSFIDESGRERIFNGVNLVFKGTEITGEYRKDYTPDWTEDTFKELSDLGINLVRLGLIWDAVEPKPGTYDDNYIDMMMNYAKMCEKYNIYFYLDMHQDLYSAAYSDGAPDWATISDSYTYRKGKITWAEGYFFSNAVQRAFDHFWNNSPILGKGLQDWYADMWQYVAKKFCHFSNLIGFDIMNEPFPGTDGGKVFWKIAKSGVKTILSKQVNKTAAIKNIIKGDTVTEALAVIDDPKIFRSLTSGGDLLIKKFDTERYYPFLRKISKAIREITTDGIIIMENCYYSNTSIPCSTPKLRYQDGTEEKNLAFSPHGYDLTVDSVYTNTASNNRVDTIFYEHRKTQTRLGVPVIVGEWGGMVPGSSEYPHLEHLLGVFDRNKWSQTYWCYHKELTNSKIMKIISRPYPIAVPGEINAYFFDRNTNTFTLRFTTETASRKKAMVYVPSAPSQVLSKGKFTTSDVNDSNGKIISFNPIKGENIITITL